MTNDLLKASIKRSHPSATIHIDKVEIYGGKKVVFFTAKQPGINDQFRIAVLVKRKMKGDDKPEWYKENDIIVAQG